MSEKREEFLNSLKPNKGNEENINHADYVFAQLNMSAREREEAARKQLEQEVKNQRDDSNYAFAAMNQSGRLREEAARVKKEIEEAKADIR